jgi:hypothetical protein
MLLGIAVKGRERKVTFARSRGTLEEDRPPGVFSHCNKGCFLPDEIW